MSQIKMLKEIERLQKKLDKAKLVKFRKLGLSYVGKCFSRWGPLKSGCVNYVKINRCGPGGQLCGYEINYDGHNDFTFARYFCSPHQPSYWDREISYDEFRSEKKRLGELVLKKRIPND